MTSTPPPSPGADPNQGYPPAYDPNQPYQGQQASGQSAPPPAYGMGGGSPAPPSAGGFFTALFDFSFSRFITPMIIRFVYVLAAVAIGVSWLVVTIAAFSDSALGGLFMLLIGPIAALIYLAFVRMTLEFYLAVVRMSEDINQRLPRG